MGEKVVSKTTGRSPLESRGATESGKELVTIRVSYLLSLLGF